MPRIERFADTCGDKHGDPRRRQFDDQSALRKEREQLAVHFEAVGAKLFVVLLSLRDERTR